MAAVAGGGTFSPATLFTNGEQGVWFDNSISYMDELGPELVTNGTFDTGTTGWTAQGSTTISAASGALVVDQPVIGTWYADNVRLVTPVLTVGKFYRIAFDARNISGTNSLRLANNATALLDMPTLTSAFQRFSVVFQCTVANTFSFFKNGLTGTFELDNISVKEVTGISNATLFQDAAGTTPVTGYEQFVGLRLDKSKGLVLGSEIAGGTPTAYTANGTVSVSGGTVTCTCTTNGNYGLSFGAVATANKRYFMTFEVVTNSAPRTIYGWAGNASADAINAGTTTGVKTGRLLMTGGSTAIAVLGGVAGESFSVRNISVRELPGNHAYQTNINARAVLSARYNLLTQTEALNEGVWVKQSGTSVTPNQATAPDGSLTADLVVGNGSSGIFQATTTVANVNYTRSIWLRSVTGTQTVRLRDPETSLGTTTCNLTTSWQRFSLTESNSGASSGVWIVNIPADGIYIWGADLRAANESSALPPYQRVGAAVNGTSTVIGTPDYDTVGFPAYLRYDGGDWYQTNSIDFSTGATNPPLGPELVTNGDFSNGATGWTLGPGVSVSGGLLVFTGLANNTTQDAVASSARGKFVSVTYTIVARTSGSIAVFTQQVSPSVVTNFTIYRTASGTYTELLFIPPNAAYFGFNTSNFVGTINNISVKEIDPLYYPDKMSVFAGVRNLTAQGVNTLPTVFELSVNSGTNNGAFGLFAYNGYVSPASTSQFNSRGTVAVGATTTDTAYLSPFTSIMAGIADISGDRALLRVNGLQVGQSLDDQGTGNYGNYPLYIGSRNGTFFFLNGREYSTIILGRGVTQAELLNTENYLDLKTFGKDMTVVYFDELTTAEGDLITAADGDQIYMSVNYQ